MSDFLHEDLQEEMYMEQPASFIQDSSLIFRLWRSFYDLKQVPLAWYEKMNSFLLFIRFVHYDFDIKSTFFEMERTLVF